MYQNNRPSIFRDTVTLAGWLFADLFLALAMLFLVFNTAGDKNSISTTPTPTRTKLPHVAATATPPIAATRKRPTFTPTVTATVPVGLDLVPGYISVNISSHLLLSNDPSEINKLKELLRLRFKPYSDRRVGLVISLGYHKEVGSGVSLAKKANSILHEIYPDMFEGAVMKPFWYSLDENHPSGTITFEVYFFAQARTP